MAGNRRHGGLKFGGALVVLFVASLGLVPAGGPPAEAEPQGIFKLEHLIFIVQENRSFDHYFGKYPGADGIPNNACVPHPALNNRCLPPFHTTNPNNFGGPHSWTASRVDVDRGKMDGFIRSAMQHGHSKRCANDPFGRRCRRFNGPRGQPDVMSFFARKDIPNYWEYADQFVLQDRMFESADSWSLPSHMFLASGWAATCKDHHNPMSCKSDPQVSVGTDPWPWTDITWLLHGAGVSWAWYVGDGTGIGCDNFPCKPINNKTATPASWNALPGFLDIKETGQQGNIKHTADFFDAAEAGTLPQVAWLIPGKVYSEHPSDGSLVPGYRYVTNAINAIMESPNWETTAIFLTWDDWGGFYDHVKPIRIDNLGYGIRVPGLLISPYAKQGVIDHQVLSYDAYLKLIEDRFLGGQRLDPDTDGRPDSRPGVRENEPKLGDLTSEFDFDQAPRPPVILDPNTFGSG